MERLKEKRICNILPYVFFLMVVAIVILTKPLNNLDELWNYNFARNIYKGNRPYIDINMVPTPLSAYISAFFLKITGNNLYSFRILSIVLSFFILTEFFILSEKMLKNRTVAFCATVFVMLLHLSYLSYDYNYLNLSLILLMMLLDRKKDKAENIWNNIAVGVIIGLTLLIKQSTGGCLILANLFVCWSDWKIYGKLKRYVFVRVSSSFFPAVLFLMLSFCNGSIADFWDYAVRGMKYFDNQISYWSFMTANPVNFVFGILPLLIAGIVIYKIKKENGQTEKREKIMLMLLSAAGFSVAFPITDQVHFYIALTPFLICFFSCVKSICMERIQSIFCNIFVVLVTGMVVGILLPKEELKGCELNHYKKIPVYPELEHQIIVVDEYISKMQEKGYEVLIADASAAVYMIPLDSYHKDFDMLLKGNTGSQSVEDLLDGKERALFLILEDERSWNWQTNRELNYYIMKHLEYIEEMSGFGVYGTKE